VTTSVERRHGLPPGCRQAKVVVDGQVRYVDSLYEDAGLAIELDGQAAHPVENRWADVHRDNARAVAGLITLRYSWADVTGRPCLIATQIAGILHQRGTVTRLRRCDPRCRVPESLLA
jgi:very-short-patch-repair endonuclease